MASVRLTGPVSGIALSTDGSTAYAIASNEVCVIDVRNALKPKLTDRIPTPSPRALLATPDRLFVSNSLHDSITVISTAERKIVAEIPLAIPSADRALDKLYGIMPGGLAYDPLTKWLLVAEAGLNTVGVVDAEKGQLIGLIPAGWMPTRVAISGDHVYIANARGRGTGPSLRRPLLELGDVPTLHRGSVTTFIMPGASELPRQSGTVLALNGIAPTAPESPKPPAAIQHVLLILKENRTFDEVLGDITSASNGQVAGTPALARFGMRGRAIGAKTEFSVQDAPITPNQHGIARQWAFSDNFYVDGDTKAETDVWLQNAWTHLQRSGTALRNFDEGSGTDTSDQSRADRFIAELDRQYGKGGETLPRFLSIHLPNDKTADARPKDGYPYAASFVEDNDLATGRIVEYLSHSAWWPHMLVLIAETDTQGSFDHIDSHRTVPLAAGPYVKRNYVSHTNASFPSLFRTTFEVLGLGPSNLTDATAARLGDLFTEEPDFSPFTAIRPDPRIFNPAK